MKNSLSGEILSWLKSFLIALIIVILCRQYLFTPSTVYGESMEPNYFNNDRIIVGKNTSIDRFDTIVFDAPDSDDYYIKRVIGLPGDHVAMKDDILYINGKPYDEPYLNEIKNNNVSGKLTGDFTLEEITGHSVVPPNSLFVLGDNRKNSYDSRSFDLSVMIRLSVKQSSAITLLKFRFHRMIII